MRINTLDSLRGIAAFCVVLNHFYYSVPESLRATFWFIDHTPLYVLVAGRFATLLFFVLSGFVLALYYRREDKPPYSEYLIRRFCRIYLPFAASILLAFGLSHLLAGYPLQGGSDFVNSMWAEPVNGPVLATHLMMTGVHASSIRLNTVMWSLIYELRISLLFPLLVWFVFRFRIPGVITAVVAGCVAIRLYSLTGQMSALYAENALGSLLLTLRYIPAFCIGILIMVKKEAVMRLMQALPPYAHALGLMLSVAVIVGLKKINYADAAYALVGAYFICLCLASARTQRLLALSPLEWLGRVSFSLYLVHMPVLLGMHYLLAGQSLWLILACALPAILISAEVMYRLAELPSIRLGKRLSQPRRNEKLLAYS